MYFFFSTSFNFLALSLSPLFRTRWRLALTASLSFLLELIHQCYNWIRTISIEIVSTAALHQYVLRSLFQRYDYLTSISVFSPPRHPEDRLLERHVKGESENIAAVTFELQVQQRLIHAIFASVLCTTSIILQSVHYSFQFWLADAPFLFYNSCRVTF